jgi:hypothetical protein
MAAAWTAWTTSNLYLPLYRETGPAPAGVPASSFAAGFRYSRVVDLGARQRQVRQRATRMRQEGALLRRRMPLRSIAGKLGGPFAGLVEREFGGFVAPPAR